MNNEHAENTWDAMESNLFRTGINLLELVLQAAQARAAQTGSQEITDLLHRTDLAPRLAIEVSGLDGNTLKMGVFLHSRATGEPVARLFEITAEGVPLPCLLH
jgi:hypothetical protein